MSHDLLGSTIFASNRQVGAVLQFRVCKIVSVSRVSIENPYRFGYERCSRLMIPSLLHRVKLVLSDVSIEFMIEPSSRLLTLHPMQEEGVISDESWSIRFDNTCIKSSCWCIVLLFRVCKSVSVSWVSIENPYRFGYERCSRSWYLHFSTESNWFYPMFL